MSTVTVCAMNIGEPPPYVSAASLIVPVDMDLRKTPTPTTTPSPSPSPSTAPSPISMNRKWSSSNDAKSSQRITNGSPPPLVAHGYDTRPPTGSTKTKPKRLQPATNRVSMNGPKLVTGTTTPPSAHIPNISPAPVTPKIKTPTAAETVTSTATTTGSHTPTRLSPGVKSKPATMQCKSNTVPISSIAAGGVSSQTISFGKKSSSSSTVNSPTDSTLSPPAPCNREATPSSLAATSEPNRKHGDEVVHTNESSVISLTTSSGPLFTPPTSPPSSAFSAIRHELPNFQSPSLPSPAFPPASTQNELPKSDHSITVLAPASAPAPASTSLSYDNEHKSNINSRPQLSLSERLQHEPKVATSPNVQLEHVQPQPNIENVPPQLATTSSQPTATPPSLAQTNDTLDVQPQTGPNPSTTTAPTTPLLSSNFTLPQALTLLLDSPAALTKVSATDVTDAQLEKTAVISLSSTIGTKRKAATIATHPPTATSPATPSSNLATGSEEDHAATASIFTDSPEKKKQKLLPISFVVKSQPITAPPPITIEQPCNLNPDALKSKDQQSSDGSVTGIVSPSADSSPKTIINKISIKKKKEKKKQKQAPAPITEKVADAPVVSVVETAVTTPVEAKGEVVESEREPTVKLETERPAIEVAEALTEEIKEQPVETSTTSSSRLKRPRNDQMTTSSDVHEDHASSGPSSSSTTMPNSDWHPQCLNETFQHRICTRVNQTTKTNSLQTSMGGHTGVEREGAANGEAGEDQICYPSTKKPKHSHRSITQSVAAMAPFADQLCPCNFCCTCSRHRRWRKEYVKESRDQDAKEDEKMMEEANFSSSMLAAVEMELDPQFAIDDKDVIRNKCELTQRFKVLDQVGSGTFSSVWRAEVKRDHPANAAILQQLKTDEPFVAIKRFLTSSHPSRLETEEEYLGRFGQLEHHILPLLGSHFQLGAPPSLILPYYCHQDFKRHYRTMSLWMIQVYLRGLLTALKHLHHFRIIHRDVKPDNYLFDFEKAKAYEDALLAGTAPFTALDFGFLVDFGLAHTECQLESEFLKDHRQPEHIAKDLRDAQQIAADEQDALAAAAAVVASADTTMSTDPPQVGEHKIDELMIQSSIPVSPSGTIVSHRRSPLKSKPKAKKSNPPVAAAAAVPLLPTFKKVSHSTVPSALLRRARPIHPRAGTRGYRPPETLAYSTEQNVKVDMWAVGCCLMSILTHKLPFFTCPDDESGLTEIFTFLSDKRGRGHETIQIGNSRVTFELNHSKVVNIPDYCRNETGIQWPDDIIDLAKQLLSIDFSQRLSAADALDHPFFKQDYLRVQLVRRSPPSTISSSSSTTGLTTSHPTPLPRQPAKRTIIQETKLIKTKLATTATNTTTQTNTTNTTSITSSQPIGDEPDQLNRKRKQREVLGSGGQTTKSSQGSGRKRRK